MESSVRVKFSMYYHWRSFYKFWHCQYVKDSSIGHLDKVTTYKVQIEILQNGNILGFPSFKSLGTNNFYSYSDINGKYAGHSIVNGRLPHKVIITVKVCLYLPTSREKPTLLSSGQQLLPNRTFIKILLTVLAQTVS